ncbi:unnamed protein product [Taenia asiatica]|uniref:Uncharacterized protein n=1 Tax=Taenia asiatica TaxID=60517 RepID=A0A0R3WBH3_TAEAS|nr:unnamed protein product [Taenia asiatica]
MNGFNMDEIHSTTDRRREESKSADKNSEERGEDQRASTSSENSPLPHLAFEFPREVIREISISGRVISSRQEFSRTEMRRNKLVQSEEEEAAYAFREASLQCLFNRMSADLEKINGDLDEKDEMLALCGLVRPKVKKILQRSMRRLEHCQQSEGKGALERLRRRSQTEVPQNVADKRKNDVAPTTKI